ncbi:MAG: lysine--tRNA ligase [Candidatus Aenigmatarchaeota archaeon]
MEEKEYTFWTDRIAKEITGMKKFKYLDKPAPNFKKFVVKSAASISGVLHIGRLSDTIRVETVHRSLTDLGFKSEFIWTADNVDPLRKIPKGVPESYKQYIGVPVTDIPDPEGCHKSYEEHHRSLYLKVVNQFIQSKMKIFSMRDEYLKGSFKKEIAKILENHEKIVEIQNKNRPKDRPLAKDWSPWQPICKNCGKIITPRVLKIEKGKVHYVCKDYQFKTQTAVGCGYEGVDNPSKGNGKLVYKSELAVQLKHWNVRAEGYGKEYIVPGSAFWINQEILEKVLGFPSIIPIFYEHLVIDGKKMSASVGNIVYPHDWLKVATPELLRLLFLKDPMRERNFRWTDIPNMFDEYDNLEKIYYGIKKVESKRDKINSKKLFEMLQIKPISKSYEHLAPFSVFLEIVKILPEKKQMKFTLNKLKEFGHLKKVSKKNGKKILERLELAKAWQQKYSPKEVTKLEVPGEVKAGVKDLIDLIHSEKDGEKLQKEIFEIAKRHGIKPVEFFRAIYMILLNSERGPRLGPYIIDRGSAEVIEKLEEVLE